MPGWIIEAGSHILGVGLPGTGVLQFQPPDCRPFCKLHGSVYVSPSSAGKSVSLGGINQSIDRIIELLLKLRCVVRKPAIEAQISRLIDLDGVAFLLGLQQGKAWMLQLLSVACISLAAKMEESEVPILLDLQVGPFSRQTKDRYAYL